MYKPRNYPALPKNQKPKHKKHNSTTTLLAIAHIGNKGRGEGIIFHRMNLSFHYVPKCPQNGLGTKCRNRKKGAKTFIYRYKSTYPILLGV